MFAGRLDSGVSIVLSTCTLRAARGASLIEAMVGITVGMIVVAGALTLFVTNLTGTRRLQAEVRLNQDLRAAVDVVARDLRRAGYWGNAIQGTLAAGAGAATAQNPYSAVSFLSDSSVRYRFSRDAVENNVVDGAEQFGLRLQDGVLQMKTATGNWQDLTDSKAVTVTAFTLTPTQAALPLGNLCPTTCAAGTPNCPITTVRRIAVTLTGRSTSDNAVTRTHSTVVRVRDDQLSGQCPA